MANRFKFNPLPEYPALRIARFITGHAVALAKQHLSGMYEKSFNGLIYCYYLAIPFFKNTLISTILFSYTAFFANSFYNQRTV